MHAAEASAAATASPMSSITVTERDGSDVHRIKHGNERDRRRQDGERLLPAVQRPPLDHQTCEVKQPELRIHLSYRKDMKKPLPS